MRLLHAAALLLGLAAGASPLAARSLQTADLAVEWNETVLKIAEKEDGFLTLKGLRTAAMMHLAMHDALNNIDHRYATYALNDPTQGGNGIAAANEAAYLVAARQYQDSLDILDALHDRWLETIAGDSARSRDVRLGELAAAAVMSSRAGDGWDSEAEYRWHPMAPGVYAEFHDHSDTPQGFVFGAGWAKARGFALIDPGQFRSPPPPAIDSADYARAYHEVKDVGRFQSINRTADQTHLALWWKDFAENSHNRLARDLIVRENLSLIESVRLLALINMSIFDAYVSVFDNKFFYNHWRPYTAIRWAANDGNPDTEPEPTWTNTHRHTYAFPSYPSAHGAACAAAMSAFAEVFGDDYAFTMRTPMVDVAGPFSGKIEMRPPTRDFERFSAAAGECALSRLYLGIHFRYDSVAGFALGQLVGSNVVGKLLLKLPPDE